MWELDGEERAAQLGIRGELGEKETAELAGLRTGVGTNTDAKEKIRLVCKRFFIFNQICTLRHAFLEFFILRSGWVIFDLTISRM
jgi:hypothetical protein